MRFGFARTTTLVAAMLAVSLLAACAAKGVRNQTRVAAVTVGQAAHEIRTVEAGLYQQGRVDKDTHLKLLENGVLPILEAATAYERAVAAWPDGANAPDSVAKAHAALLLALDQLDQITPAVDVVRTPLAAATAALRVLLAKQVATSATIPLSQAQLPGGGVIALLSIAEMIAGAYARIRQRLVQEGATNEQLAAVDALLINDQAEVRQEIADLKGQA